MERNLWNEIPRLAKAISWNHKLEKHMAELHIPKPVMIKSLVDY